MPRRRAPDAQVVTLQELRVARRMKTYRDRLERVLKSNRRAFTKIYATGLLFTRQGTRAGRDLLLAHEHLLRVVALLDRMSHQGDVPPPRKPGEVEAVFEELDTLLERTSELTEHTVVMLEQLKRE